MHRHPHAATPVQHRPSGPTEQVLKLQGMPYMEPEQGRTTRLATAELVAVILVLLKEQSLNMVDTVGPSGLFFGEGHVAHPRRVQRVDPCVRTEVARAGAALPSHDCTEGHMEGSQGRRL